MRTRVSVSFNAVRVSAGHHRVAVIVFRIFAADGFQQRTRLGRTVQAQQALAEMRAGVNVVRLAFQRGAITFFRLGKFSFLKINIAELEMMIGVVEMMNLRLQFLDARAALRAGQFKAAACPPGGGAIDEKIIQNRRQPEADENEDGPESIPAGAGRQ